MPPALRPQALEATQRPCAPRAAAWYPCWRSNANQQDWGLTRKIYDDQDNCFASLPWFESLVRALRGRQLLPPPPLAAAVKVAAASPARCRLAPLPQTPVDTDVVGSVDTQCRATAMPEAALRK